MTDFEYPPTESTTLGAALEDAERDRDDAEERVTRLEQQANDDTQEDPEDSEVADAIDTQHHTEDITSALDWLTNEFGEDATVTVEAFTATERARTLDTVQREVMGSVGSEERRQYFIAAALSEAPWLPSDVDLVEAKRITGELPPSVQDWLDELVTNVNDLGNS